MLVRTATSPCPRLLPGYPPLRFFARMASSSSPPSQPQPPSSKSGLAASSCEPCKGDSPSIPPSEYASYLSQLSPEWRIEPFQGNPAPALQRDFKFKNFKQALRFGNAIGEIAETPGIKHHPAIVIEWGRVTCAWWTHAIGGVSVGWGERGRSVAGRAAYMLVLLPRAQLHQNDFICAAKTDEAATAEPGLVN